MLHIAVNPLDLWVAAGSVAGGGQALPFVVGTEGVGELNGHLVLVHGAGLGVSRDGVCREFADVPASACTPLPEGIDPLQACGAAVAAVTAWRLVHDLTHANSDDVALVLGASGGVGSLLVQVLAAAGCRVTAQTSSEGKAGALRELGADEVIVAEASELPDLGTAPTVVFDPLGGGATVRAVALLAPFGRIALFGTSHAPAAEIDLRALYRKAGCILGYSATIEPPERLAFALQRVLVELSAGRLRIPIDSVLPLGDAAEAHRRIRDRQVFGKLILDPTR